MSIFKDFIGVHRQNLVYRRRAEPDDIVEVFEGEAQRNDGAPDDLVGAAHWDWTFRTYATLEQNDFITYAARVWRVIYTKTVHVGAPMEPALTIAYCVEAVGEVPDVVGGSFDPLDFDPKDWA